MLFILNNKSIEEKDKIEYLEDQQNQIEHISEIDAEYRTLALKLSIIVPSWENVIVYYQEKKTVDCDLKNFIIKNSDSMVGKEVLNSADEEEYIFQAIALDNSIQVAVYSKLLSYFRRGYTKFQNSTSLDLEHLHALIGNGCISFSKENTEYFSTKEDALFAEYVKFHEKHIDELLAYIICNRNVADALIMSMNSSISIENKIKIINSLSKSLIDCQLSEYVLTNLVEYLSQIKRETLRNFIKNIDDINFKINSAIKYLSIYGKNAIKGVQPLIKVLPKEFAYLLENGKKKVDTKIAESYMEFLLVLEKTGYLKVTEKPVGDSKITVIVTGAKSVATKK